MQDKDSTKHRKENAGRCDELSGPARDVRQEAYDRECYYPHTDNDNDRCK